MILNPGRRFTAEERERMESMGYEFQDATTIADSKPHFVVTNYRAPRVDPRPPRWEQDLGDWGT